MEEIKKSQEYREIPVLKVRVGTGETTKYAVHQWRLYYQSGRDEEVRLRLYVPKWSES